MTVSTLTYSFTKGGERTPSNDIRPAIRAGFPLKVQYGLRNCRTFKLEPFEALYVY